MKCFSSGEGRLAQIKYKGRQLELDICVHPKRHRVSRVALDGRAVALSPGAFVRSAQQCTQLIRDLPPVLDDGFAPRVE